MMWLVALVGGVWAAGYPFLWERQLGHTDWRFERVYSRLLFTPIMIINPFIRFVALLANLSVGIFCGVHVEPRRVMEIVDKITLRDRIVGSYIVL